MSRIPRIPSWPAADQEMWRRLLKDGNPLDEKGGLAHLREASCRMLEEAYGRWISWLNVSDPEALEEPPAARATAARLRRWLGALEHLSPMTRQLALSGVLRVLKASAPELNWSDRLGAGRQIRRNSLRARSDRKLGRVLSSAVLLQAGLTLASTSAQAARTRLEEAKRQRDGTMVAVLALLPMRRRAFVGLRLGQSIHLSGDGIYISLTEDMTKTGIAWETRVPAEASVHLHRYIIETRPFLVCTPTLEHRKLEFPG